MTVIIEVNNLTTRLKDQQLHEHVSLTLNEGEILGIIGGSGSGKSVLLRVLLGLMTPISGDILFWGESYRSLRGQKKLKENSGVVFQNGALFSSLTVQENLELPLQVAGLSSCLTHDLAALRLEMVGLSHNTLYKYPSELSGGMIKRVALARAIILDPKILFLDEPTAGLDPIAAETFDSLLKHLQRHLGLSVIMVTHDLDSLEATCDRVGALVDKKMIIGTLTDMKKNTHPWLQHYFNARKVNFPWKPKDTH